MTGLTLDPGRVTLTELERVYRDRLPVRISRASEAAIRKASERVAQAARGDAAVYGVNTGFGKLASVKIAAGDTATLQRNLILSHCCGVGEPLDETTTRLMMALKLLSLGRAASGVRRGCAPGRAQPAAGSFRAAVPRRDWTTGGNTD